MFSFLEKKGILYLEMNTLKTTEGAVTPSAYTIAWFPTRGSARIWNKTHLKRTQGWVLFLTVFF